MVNVDKFAERLNIIMNYYELSAALFAEKIDVQRSSISHVLSGRNKPSLEFVLKVVTHFPEVNLYWLLNGKGSFPQVNDYNTPSATIKKEKEALRKEVSKVIIFYTDGTFETFDKN